MPETPANTAAQNDITAAIEQQATQSISSVTIDGMTTALNHIDPIKADQYLAKKRAQKNRLGCLNFFKIKSGE